MGQNASEGRLRGVAFARLGDIVHENQNRITEDSLSPCGVVLPMASPEVLDFDKLLEPLPGDNPAGEALREDFSPTSIYYQIKDARTAARNAERTVVWDDEEGAEAPKADWRPILDLAPQILAERSKDLEVAAWLIEALLREHGYPGLRDGFRLARELVERFWDHLYPLPDEDGVTTRVAPLTGLNGDDAEGVLLTPIFNVPVTAPSSYAAMTVSDYKQGLELDGADPQKREQRIAQGAVSLQMFRTAVSETPVETFRELLDDLGQCAEEWDKLNEVLEEKCGSDESGYPLAPPSSNVRNALTECREHVEDFTRDLLGLEEPPEEAQGAEGAMVPSSSGDGAAVSGRVQTRDDAFRALLQVAEFFKRTEPHSPVSYALEQAVRWGRMPLADLWSELIPDETTRDQVFKLVGIKPPEEENQ